MTERYSDAPESGRFPRRTFLEIAGGAGATIGMIAASTDSVAAQPDNEPGRNGRCYSLFIDNEYVPLAVDQQSILQGTDDEGVTVRVQITVFDETEDVAGVTTRVFEEREWESEEEDPVFPEDFELVEVSENYAVQTCDGTVRYFGESVDIYEDGEIVDDTGTWRADDADSAPGTLMTTWPVAGARWQQEVAPGVALDEAAIVETGVDVDLEEGDFDTFEDCIRVYEWNPIEGQTGPPSPLPDPLPEDPPDSWGDEKFFAPEYGLIVDEDTELIDFTEGRPGRREGRGS